MRFKFLLLLPLAALPLLWLGTAKSPLTTFDRTSIEKQLAAKYARKEPLRVHVFVPLCDNVNQGIVPTNATLGNGQNPTTNLYWGAGYGVKTHLKRAEGWKLLGQGKPAEAEILDRALFERTLANGSKIQLVADAYDGAHMAACIRDFYASLAGQKSGDAVAGTGSLPGWSAADLVVFNGHNGLMDIDVDVPARKDTRQRDAVVIACASKGYFLDPLSRLGGYPLITTTGLLAPEAYVLKGVVETWAALKTGAEVRIAAGTAYNTYQKCGIKGATNLFHSGW